jgi:hypothetical protein
MDPAQNHDKSLLLCCIFGSHEEFHLLVSGIVWSDRSSQTFRGKYSLHLLGQTASQASNQQRPPETSVKLHQTTRRHILRNSMLHYAISSGFLPGYRNDIPSLVITEACFWHCST